jgi:hypothetical protein
MSFYLHKSKPNLIDLKLLKSYNNKIKNKYSIIESSNNIKNTYIDDIKKYIFDFIYNFIKEYYGLIIFLVLFIILLYIRYIEVLKRKAKLKQLLFNDEILFKD